MNQRPLILLGSGGHCKSVIDAAESAGMRIDAILSLPEEVGGEVLGHPIAGTDDDIPEYIETHDFIITVGQIKNTTVRIRLDNTVKSLGGRFAKVIASTARVSPHAEVGEGSVVLHHATVNATARIGRQCIINTAANIEHDAVIGDFCHISTGAMINGTASVGCRTFIGSGAVVINNISVCEDVVLAAGSVAVRRITKPGIYTGIRAKLFP